VTASEIISELPNLSEAERREILHRILELDGNEGEMQFADDLLVTACRNIDDRERADAQRFSHEAAVQTFQAIDKEETGGGDRRQLT
jgi:hypothetical protein